jgi:hypothetical protein
LFDIPGSADDDSMTDDKDVWVYEDGAIAVVHTGPDGRPLGGGEAAMLRNALTAVMLARQVIPTETH